ncbi:MAG: GyrI-like domain-containing protein [Roseicyclus sp.]|uniref:AraC family transcriptional regulator n=1 Tax=Boseongicola sp. H5 TaxID=2763261 RepID=UPI001B1AFB02|nr:GyrI-like domain-containing protein [Boseongicola sp. H5]MBO6602758.1 GyrI-like domain-containing protein [Roseicyclus sp.]MBO6623989.1 GyrI-like domain-containing protein [Roseicyclus sp.]MBO6923002.1 GyrI-like domain-containing protein [Roseicyclus sp.]
MSWLAMAASGLSLDIRDSPPLRVGALVHRGAHHEIGESFGRLMRILAGGNAVPMTRGMISLHREAPGDVPEADLLSHAGAIWVGPGALPPGLVEITVPPGRVAVCRYRGPYDGLGAVWAQFTPARLAAHRLVRRDAPAFALYLNSPVEVAPADLLTDLCLPVV